MRKIGILEKIIRRFSAKEKLLEEKKIGLEVAIYKRYNNNKKVWRPGNASGKFLNGPNNFLYLPWMQRNLPGALKNIGW